jgi:[ribosomal protein S18]-alanine N-acetyltransferase
MRNDEAAPRMPSVATAAAISVRPAAVADLAVVVSWVTNQEELTRWTGPRYTYPLDAATLPEQFDWATSESWVVTDGGAVVAFGQHLPRGPHRRHLARIITAPARRGEGLAARVVRHVLDRAKASGATVASLNVRPGNDEALRLYRRLGFVDAVRPPEDAPLPSTYLEYRF